MSKIDIINMDEIFIELLQVVVGNRHELSLTPSAEEWETLYDMAKKQAMVGVCFYGLKQLPEAQQPPARRLRQWAVKALQLQEKNMRMNAECRMVTASFRKAGFNGIVLKGQGNMANYPEELLNLRQCGDIDIWVKPKAGLRDLKNPVRQVIEYCCGIAKGDFVYYHNLDFPVLKKTPIEVHYRPSWLFCPWRDRYLQKWLNARFVGEKYDGYFVPSVEFNVVFQLLHLYKHIFEEGIGFRQMLDYYFVLKRYHQESASADIMPVLKRLGMKGFAGAVMYVMREVFAMPVEYMLCEPRQKEGQQLLDDILVGGNFGKYDETKKWELAPDSDIITRTMYAMQKLRHNFRYLRYYPMEVLWEPAFRWYHWAWRTFCLWKY